ncbi:hypothetical protein [Rhodoplanes sp. Z2-YC6860]|uniref:hypothetical protein n=1 Tax=Rhodoplanes sp. Z2-YC6860 TaxID=674703 RepID=UPI0012ED6ED1|nr:hypothetical protein [Rhodoplanes sp. Z2-YC6860]
MGTGGLEKFGALMPCQAAYGRAFCGRKPKNRESLAVWQEWSPARPVDAKIAILWQIESLVSSLDFLDQLPVFTRRVSPAKFLAAINREILFGPIGPTIRRSGNA